MLYRAIRSLLFRMEAEEAHEFVTRQMEALQEIPIALRVIHAAHRISAPVQLLGLRFPTPVGIAAGFDKDARLIPMLAALGFGFIEVGTVTLRPQAGNPKPRLFRYPEHRALINRMGFNNRGVDAMVEQLRKWSAARATSPAKLTPPIFVNVGRNRDVTLEGAADDYAECYRRIAPCADVAVLNLSSPNTPGLRDLQLPEQLEKLLRAVDKRGPILVKIAPDLDDTQLGEICDVAVRMVDGMICTNTTVDRLPGMNEGGGLSGEPLKAKADAILAKVRARVGAAFPLVGVGGVFSAADAREKIAAGADLVQVYTGFIYEGPGLPRKLARGMMGMSRR